VVLAASGFLYGVALHFDYTPTQGRLGPDAWPRLILGLMMAICAYEIVKTLFVGGKHEVEGVLESIIEDAADKEPDEAAPEKTYPHLLGLGIALTVGYVAVIQTLGFFLATALYLAIFMVLGRYRRPGVILATSLLGSLAFVVVFMKVVYVSLPLGTGPFLAVSAAILRVLGIR
jgi:hypothetical protein